MIWGWTICCWTIRGCCNMVWGKTCWKVGIGVNCWTEPWGKKTSCNNQEQRYLYQWMWYSKHLVVTYSYCIVTKYISKWKLYKPGLLLELIVGVPQCSIMQGLMQHLVALGRWMQSIQTTKQETIIHIIVLIVNYNLLLLLIIHWVSDNTYHRYSSV